VVKVEAVISENGVMKRQCMRSQNSIQSFNFIHVPSCLFLTNLKQICSSEQYVHFLHYGIHGEHYESHEDKRDIPIPSVMLNKEDREDEDEDFYQDNVEWYFVRDYRR
jgi:hypothetical protein